MSGDRCLFGQTLSWTWRTPLAAVRIQRRSEWRAGSTKCVALTLETTVPIWFPFNHDHDLSLSLIMLVKRMYLVKFNIISFCAFFLTTSFGHPWLYVWTLKWLKLIILLKQWIVWQGIISSICSSPGFIELYSEAQLLFYLSDAQLYCFRPQQL